MAEVLTLLIEKQAVLSITSMTRTMPMASAAILSSLYSKIKRAGFGSACGEVVSISSIGKNKLLLLSMTVKRGSMALSQQPTLRALQKTMMVLFGQAHGATEYIRLIRLNHPSKILYLITTTLIAFQIFIHGLFMQTVKIISGLVAATEF